MGFRIFLGYLLLAQSTIDGLHLVVLWRQGAVAHHDAVHAEGMQVRLIAKVTTIKHRILLIFHLKSFIFHLHNPLVHPVPDEASKHTGVRIDFVPILLKISQGVAHRVSILAGQHGSRSAVAAHPRTVVARSVSYFQQPFPAGILSPFLIRALRDAGVQVVLHHSRIEARNDVDGLRIGLTLSTLVVDGTRGVELVQPCRHGCLVGSVAALVAQTPEDDARVVFVPLGHADSPIEESVSPVGCRGQIGGVRVTVHTTNLDGLAVDEQLSTTDVNLTEAHLQSGLFDVASGSILQGQFQGVKVWLLGRP